MIYHFLGFILRPFTIYMNGQSFLWLRIGTWVNSTDITYITLVSNLAILAVFSGFLFVNKGQVIKKMPSYELRINHMSRFIIAVVCLTALGYYGTYKSLFGAGLDTVYAYETALDGDSGRRLIGVSGYVTALAEFLPIICIILYLSKTTRRFSYVFILAFVAVRMYAGAQRLSFVVVLAALFLIFHIEKKVRYPKVMPVLVILLFAFIFEIIGNDRYAFRKLYMGEANFTSIFSDYLAERGGNALTSDIVEYDVATSVIKVVREYDEYSFGTQYLRILIWPIPRQIWNDKPVYTSIVDLNDYGDFRYLTTSLYADTFMVLGFPTVIIMMFTLGVFICWIYKYLIYKVNVYLFGFYWVLLIYLKTILRDGGVTVMYFWIFSMLCYLIIICSGKVTLCLKK